MTFTVDDSQKEGSLVADGSLTVQQAAEFKDALTKALNEVDSLEINLDNVTEVDLTCLQLLCAAHKTCMKTNKTLKISHQHTEALKEAVKNAGYERHRGCKEAGGDNQCLWLSGGTHG